MFAMLFGQAVQCVVSNKRLKSFLAEEEVERIPTLHLSGEEGDILNYSVVISGVPSVLILRGQI